MINPPYMPEGYVKLPATEVWKRGERIVILGLPSGIEDDAQGHDCDVMGCGSVGSHVIGIAMWLYGDRMQTE